MGIDGVDDAGVYKLTDDMALVLTLDFFPPIVDDPYIFGQVAAANALSDIYAMGGRPITALNILAVPANIPAEITGDILRGGADKVAEAGAVIAGGHSVKDNELKYGLAVTGLVHPDKILANKGALTGDHLLLTKPLGTGIISTAVKKSIASPQEIETLTKSMTALNKAAAETAIEYGAHAVTDITGFGLAGHTFEMAKASNVSVEIQFDQLKLLPGTIKHARAGALTGGANATRQYLEGKIELASALEKHAHDIVYDAQTSGGLLLAIAPEKANDCLAKLKDCGLNAADIGRVITRRDAFIYIS